MGRNERRRRVLKEEVLSASSSHVALRAANRRSGDGEVRRYSEAAGRENSLPMIDLVPRRRRTISMITLIGLGLVAGLLALDYYVLPHVAVLGLQATATIDLAAPMNLATWFSAAVLLAASGTCLVIYTVRRHKIADYRGRYRIWIGSSAALWFLSVCSIAPLHRLLGATLAYQSGWTALRADGVWWLALLGLPLGYVAVRALMDLAESRLAMCTMIVALAAHGVGLAAFFGGLPIADPKFALMTTVGATLAGNWLILMGTVFYARHVVLDAQGLIAVREPRAKAEKTSAKLAGRSMSSSKAAASKSTASSSTSSLSREEAVQKAAARKSTTEWVDGSQPERDSYDDDDDGSHRRQRKLSKAERKRLRKQKARDRAA